MGLTWVARLSRFKGCNLFKEGQYEEAVEAFTKAISIEPDEIAGYSNRSAALMKLERWDEVILDASRCLELDPNHARSLSRKARALYNMGDYPEAIENAEKAAQMKPDLRDSMEELKRSCEAAMRGEEVPASVMEQTVPSTSSKASKEASPLPPKAAAAVEAVLAAPAVTDVAPPLEATPAPPAPLPPASPPLADVPLPSPEPSFASAVSSPLPLPPAPTEAPGASSIAEEALEDERLPEAVDLEAKIDEMSSMFGRNTKKAVAAWSAALQEFPGQPKWHVARGHVRVVLRELEPAIADLTAAVGLVPAGEEASSTAHTALERRAQARALLGDLHGAAEDAGAAIKRAPTAQDRASAQAALANYMAQLQEAKEDGKAPGTKPPAAVEIAMAQGEEMAAEGLKYMEKLRRKEAAYQMAVRVRNEGRRLRNAARRAGGPPPTEATTETVALGDGNELLLTRLPIVFVEKEEETEKVSATPAATAALPQEAPADNDGGFKTSYDEGICALRAKRWQDAEMAFSTAAAAAPPARLPWCHLKRSAARLGAGYPEGALEELDKAQNSAPKAAEDAPLWLELRQTRAKALERLGRLDAAREELEEADAELHDLITPQQKNLLLGKITDLLEKKSKAADAATRRSPTARSAARASATTAAATKSPQQRPLIEEITSPNPIVEQAAAAAGGSSPDDLACKAEAARSHFDNAMQALKSKSFVEAKKGFQMASILDPSLMDAHKHLALMEVVMENWGKVEAHCTAALAAPGGEEDDEVRVMRASAYVNQGRRLEALTEYSILSAQFGNVEAGKKVEKLRKELVGSGELSEEEAARLVGAKQAKRGGGEGSAPPASSPAPFTALLDPNFDMKTFDELESIDFAKVGPQVR